MSGSIESATNIAMSLPRRTTRIVAAIASSPERAVTMS